MSLAPVLPPLLRDGDRLTADEFLRRWEAMPDVKHAELIDGIVYMPSPVSEDHSEYQSTLTWWLKSYQVATPGCRGGLEATWKMGDRQVPQPDCTLQIAPGHGGQSLVEGGYWTAAPELVIEVTISSRSRDLGVKYRLYEQMGVQEYLVAVVAESTLIWHELTPKGFHLRNTDLDDISRSVCFPGLWLDAAALWRLDYSRVQEVLQQGLASPEHAEFVARLSRPDQAI